MIVEFQNLKEWLQQNDYADSSIKQVRNILAQYNELLLEPEKLLGECEERGLSANTLNIIKWVVWIIAQYKEDVLGIKSTYKLQWSKPPEKRVIQVPDYLKLKRKILSMKTRTFCQLRNKVLLLMGMTYATRIGELGQMRRQDVDVIRGKVFIRAEKHGRDSEYAIPVELLEPLKEYLIERDKRSETKWLWVRGDGVWYKSGSINQMIRRKWGLSSHIMFRHALANYLANNNVSMVVIQEILRHRYLSNTETYLQKLVNMTDETIKNLDKLGDNE